MINKFEGIPPETVKKATTSPRKRNVQWSVSKMNVANECLYKYKRSYVDKVKITADYFTLGEMAHLVMEKGVENGWDQASELRGYMEEYVVPHYQESSSRAGMKPENYALIVADMYKMVPAMVTFLNKFHDYREANGVTFNCEGKVAISSDLKASQFFSPDAYLRGVIDLWGYNPDTKTLLIVDHKTNKAKESAEAVRNHVQLNIYGAILPLIHNLDVERVQMGLHFIRKTDTVWATKSRYEVNLFLNTVLGELENLERKIIQAKKMEKSGSIEEAWPRSRGISCRWCGLKDECALAEQVDNIAIVEEPETND